MDVVSRMLQTPLEITMADKKYRLSPLSLKARKELEAWLRDATWQAARQETDRIKSLPAISDTIKDELMKDAVNDAIRFSRMGLGCPILTSADGFVKLLLASILPNHPEVTEEWLNDHLGEIDTTELEAKITELNAQTDIGTGGEASALTDQQGKKTK